MNGSKHCITSKNKTTLYLVTKERALFKSRFFSSSCQPIKLGAYFNFQDTAFLLADIQIQIDFLRADMTEKDTFKQGTSLYTV